jgi:hypothetical protein
MTYVEFKKALSSVKFFLTKGRQFCSLVRIEETFHKLSPRGSESFRIQRPRGAKFRPQKRDTVLSE